MAKIVVDEDLHRSIAEPLQKLGHIVLDVRDHGLQGASDQEIFEFAKRQKAALLTGDLGFANPLLFPPGSHYGIIVAWFPNEMSVAKINEEVLKGLIILEPGRVRLRLPDELP